MINDLRYAIRTLTHAPGFAAIAVLTLALGIGANTAIFSVVNGVLLRPLPFNDYGRIMRVYTSSADEPKSGHSAADFRDLLHEQQSLAFVAGYRDMVFTAIARSNEPIQVEASSVTVEYFDVLGVTAEAGRLFSRGSDNPRGERVVVLSAPGARRLYGSSAQAVGQRLRINGEPHTVLGVVTAGREWPEGEEVWQLAADEVPPSPIEPTGDSDREVRYFEVIARLKPGVTFEQSEQDLHRVAALQQERRSATSKRRDLRLVPLHEEIVGNVRFGLVVMQLAVGLVLLIACANVSSLMIARATGRQRELAIRAALGADRTRLIRQLLTESLLLGVVGGLAGLIAGAWLTVLIVRVLPENVPRTSEITLDYVVAVATLLAALATGVLLGVMPALQASRTDATTALKRGGGRTGTRAPARAALVVVEVALTLVLLAGAGLLLNSFLRLQNVDPGLRPENVTMVSLMVPQTRYATGPAQATLYRQLIEGLAGRPEVQAVGVVFPSPLSGSHAGGAFSIEGRPAKTPADRPFTNISLVSGGYFQAMGIPLMSGRTFTDSDRREAPPVVIVSAALARKYWLDESPIGKGIRFDEDSKEAPITIVGVVGDVRQFGLDQEPTPIMYFPYEQFTVPVTTIAVRSTASESSIAALVRAQLTAVDPELPPGDVKTLENIIERSVAQPRFRTALISAFAIVALLLAALGVYGLISYSVTQRTREIGIRIALGAQPAQVVGPMIREGLVLAAVGTGLGLVGALLSGRILASFLFGVEATDPITFAVVAIVLLGVALIATYIPSRRALRVDPITALRTE